MKQRTADILIVINGINRFNIVEEVENKNLYRECKINIENYTNDFEEKDEEIKFTDLELLF